MGDFPFSEAFGSPVMFEDAEPLARFPDLTTQKIDYGVWAIRRGEKLVVAGQENMLHRAVAVFELGDPGGVLAAIGITEPYDLEPDRVLGNAQPSAVWIVRAFSAMSSSKPYRGWTRLSVPEGSDWDDDWNHVMSEFDRAGIVDYYGRTPQDVPLPDANA